MELMMTFGGKDIEFKEYPLKVINNHKRKQRNMKNIWTKMINKVTRVNLKYSKKIR